MGINISTINAIVAAIPAVSKVVLEIIKLVQQRQAENSQRKNVQREFLENIAKNKDEDEIRRKLERVQRELHENQINQQAEIDRLVAQMRNARPSYDFSIAHGSLRDHVSLAEYDATFPIPEFLQNHKIENPKSYYVQLIGVRGNGKSTFVNKILRSLGIEFKI